MNGDTMWTTTLNSDNMIHLCGHDPSVDQGEYNTRTIVEAPGFAKWRDAYHEDTGLTDDLIVFDDVKIWRRKDDKSRVILDDTDDPLLAEILIDDIVVDDSDNININMKTN